MRPKTMMIGILTVCVTLISFGSAIGAGGPGPSDNCAEAVDEAVVTDASPLIQGTFTAAHFIKKVEGEDENFIRINAVLEKPMILIKLKDDKHPWGEEVVIRKLFSKERPAKNDQHLCNLKNSDLIELYKLAPCMWELGHAFGIAGTPVLTDLKMTDIGSSCGGGDGLGWISGIVKIRVVPDSSE